jgi:hypothetical protein
VAVAAVDCSGGVLAGCRGEAFGFGEGVGQGVAEPGVFLLEGRDASVWRWRKARCRSVVVAAMAAGYRPLLTGATVVSNAGGTAGSGSS